MPSQKRKPGPNALDIKQDPKKPKTSDGKPKIDQQKVKFRDKLFKVVEIFFSMADMTIESLTEEMKNKNQELIKKIDIITGKNDIEIRNISIDYMVSAFKEFRECYTEVKEHLLANDDINSNESLKTLVDKTCTKIDADISTMLEHDIIKYQELKQDFQSKVDRYNSLGITLPDQEVEEINSDEGNLGTNLERFETLVKNAINKLKDQYVEKMKVKLAKDIEGYLETISFMDQLKAILKDAQTLALEETIENLENFEKYIEDRRMRGKLIAQTERFEPITDGLPKINGEFSELTQEDLARFQPI